MKFFFFPVLFFIIQSGLAQNIFKARIADATSKGPLTGATALVNGTSLGSNSDKRGFIEINNVPDGKQEIEFRFIGYQTKVISFIFPRNYVDTIEAVLELAETSLDDIVVSATRSSRSIDDIPIRIETITAGELEEKAVMQPTSIKMLLTEST